MSFRHGWTGMKDKDRSVNPCSPCYAFRATASTFCQEVVDIIGSLLAAWQASIKKQKRAAWQRLSLLGRTTHVHPPPRP